LEVTAPGPAVFLDVPKPTAEDALLVVAVVVEPEVEGALDFEAFDYGLVVAVVWV